MRYWFFHSNVEVDPIIKCSVDSFFMRMLDIVKMHIILPDWVKINATLGNMVWDYYAFLFLRSEHQYILSNGSDRTGFLLK